MLKRALVFMLCSCLVFVAAACDTTVEDTPSASEPEVDLFNEVHEPSVNEDGTLNLPGANKYTDPSIYTIDTLVAMGVEQERTSAPEIQSKAEKLEQSILDNPDTLKPAEGGKYIYVANGGIDRRGYGLEPDKPVETIEYAHLLANEGDVIVLRRGHFWRTSVDGKKGVSYGAYGEGDKPTIYGALSNSAKKTWEKIDDNVYKVQSGTALDIGLIVFDHGKVIGTKKSSLEKLAKDYDFYSKGGYLYVYSSKGDPSKLFSDIEFCHNKYIFKLSSNSTIQNWRIMYGGGHGISTGYVKNIAVDGCVIGYIGGSYQMDGQTVRFGNGVEVWGSCNGYTITNCHVYQCYDAGITMQLQGETTETWSHQNILFENNLLELNNYNIEYFLNLARDSGSKIKNVAIKDNIIRDGGFGWGYYSRYDRNYGTNVMGVGVNVAENFVYTNNIFDNAKSMLLAISAYDAKHFPTFKGNTYALHKDTRVLKYHGVPFTNKDFGKEADIDILGDKTAKVIFY